VPVDWPRVTPVGWKLEVPKGGGLAATITEGAPACVCWSEDAGAGLALAVGLSPVNDGQRLSSVNEHAEMDRSVPARKIHTL
jgi:hypothetical protein